jgi:hypothetical protein
MVDIDGTICSEFFLLDGSKNYNKAKPIKDRIKKLNNLFDKGNEIHYWTARGSLSGLDHKELTVKQLMEWGCKYTSLRVGDKPHYDIWVDDKAVWSEEYFRNK